MANRTRKSLALIGIGAAAVLSISACTSDDSSDTTMDTTTSTMTETTAPMETTESAAAMPAGLVGPGCAAYAEQVPTGPGSVEGMAQENVTTAASNNPMLTTLTAAVSGQLNPDVNLVDTLNGGEFTVFAPVDDAFALVDPATIETLKTDSALLTDVLTYTWSPVRSRPPISPASRPPFRAAASRSRLRRRVDGQRRQRDLRWHRNSERDRLPDRRCPDAAVVRILQ